LDEIGGNSILQAKCKLVNDTCGTFKIYIKEFLELCNNLEICVKNLRLYVI